MDTNRFDALARQLGTRRSLLSALAVAASALASRVADDAVSKKKKHKKKKCKHGTLRCGKACVNAQTDAQNCGACGMQCPSGTACVSGACSSSACSGSKIRCGNLCVDPSSNEDHCGRCNNPCTGELTCLDGTCDCAASSDTACSDFCINTNTNRENCGACDHECPAGQICRSGACTAQSCNDGERQCGDGTCIPLDDDRFCCSKSDCGPGDDLQCVDHACACQASGVGRCPDPRFRCAECCPGGVGMGAHCGPGDAEWICTSETQFGCTCPPGKQECKFNTRLCTLDPKTDPHRCGDSCRDCDEQDPGAACCNGSCSRGCAPGTSCGNGPNNIPCPANNCQPCPSGTLCCNRGPGTQAQCVNYASAFCPPTSFYED